MFLLVSFMLVGLRCDLIQILRYLPAFFVAISINVSASLPLPQSKQIASAETVQFVAKYANLCLSYLSEVQWEA